jgi:hypothetical protein
MGLEGDADGCERVEAVEEVGVERKTEVGEWEELRRVAGVCGGEHSGGGGGGHGETAALIDDRNSCAAMSKFEGSRETNHPGTNNDNTLICLGGGRDWIGDGVRRRHDLHYPAVIVQFAHVREWVRRYTILIERVDSQRRIGFQSLVFSRF